MYVYASLVAAKAHISWTLCVTELVELVWYVWAIWGTVLFNLALFICECDVMWNVWGLQEASIGMGMKLTFYHDWLIFHGLYSTSMHACHACTSWLFSRTDSDSVYLVGVKKKSPLNWPVRGAGMIWDNEMLDYSSLDRQLARLEGMAASTTHSHSEHWTQCTGGGALKSKDGQKARRDRLPTRLQCKDKQKRSSTCHLWLPCMPPSSTTPHQNHMQCCLVRPTIIHSQLSFPLFSVLSTPSDHLHRWWYIGHGRMAFPWLPSTSVIRSGANCRLDRATA